MDVDWFQPSKTGISDGIIQLRKIFGFPETQTNSLSSTFISLVTRIRGNSVRETALKCSENMANFSKPKVTDDEEIKSRLVFFRYRNLNIKMYKTTILSSVPCG